MTPPLLIVLPLSAADLPLCSSLLTHISHLGPVLGHGILFVADKSLTRAQTDPIVAQAQPLFPAGGEMIHCAVEVSPPYPHAHNLRFETAARHIATTRKVPFLWLDPRCVPTRKTWLVEIEAEYRAHAHLTPIMGHLLTPEINGTAEKLVATPAVYPAELPKRVYQRLIARRDTEWEKSCADLLVPIAHPTLLIWTHALNGTKALPKPPATAALVQTQMARDYAALVRGEKVVAADPLIDPQTIAVAPPSSNVATKASYYHSGNLGDVIYALAAIKLAGGGRLLLGPRQKRTSPCSNPIKGEAYDLLSPLLAVQPYIPSTAFIDRYPGTDQAFDLNRFRNSWDDKDLRAKLNVHNLAAMHAHTLGVLEKWHPSQTWLTVPGVIRTNMFTVHRSSRYRSTGPDAFPWNVVAKHFAKRLLFVGLSSEHSDFQREFNVKVSFWQAQDFLELARVIAGSLGFIGNQSFPCSIAIGCGQRVLQESWPQSPDCLFPRKNFATQPVSIAALEKWESC